MFTEIFTFCFIYVGFGLNKNQTKDKKDRMLTLDSKLIPTIKEYEACVLRQFPFFGGKFVQLNQMSVFFLCWSRDTVYVKLTWKSQSPTVKLSTCIKMDIQL